MVSTYSGLNWESCHSNFNHLGCCQSHCSDYDLASLNAEDSVTSLSRLQALFASRNELIKQFLAEGLRVNGEREG